MADDNKRQGGGSQANLNLPALLAGIGQAVSPEGSWQDRMSGMAGDMAEEEQSRRFLAGILSGQEMPEIKGQIGLNPEVILQGIKTRAALQPEREEPMAQVETPFGTQQVPQSEAADYSRKVWAEQHTAAPSSVRTFEAFRGWDEDKQKAFLEFSKTQRGKTFEESLAEFLAKQEASQRQRKRVETELTLGTPEHIDEIKKDLDQADVGEFRTNYLNKYPNRNLPYKAAEELYAIEKTARQMEDNFDKYRRVVYRKSGEKGPGFYGYTKDGKKEFIRKLTPRFE